MKGLEKAPSNAAVDGAAAYNLHNIDRLRQLIEDAKKSSLTVDTASKPIPALPFEERR